jgi:hypothetical protein
VLWRYHPAHEQDELVQRTPLRPPVVPVRRRFGRGPGRHDGAVQRGPEPGEHRQQLEKVGVAGSIRIALRGQTVAAIVAISLAVAAAGAAFAGEGAAAVAIASIDVVGFGGIFVWGRRSQERERKEKAEAQLPGG